MFKLCDSSPTAPLLITGAAGGLGRALAVEAARRGWDLVLTDRTSTALADLSAALARSYGVRVCGLACDLSEPAARARLLEDISRLVPGLGGLVNVAGVDFEGAFEELEPAEIQAIVRVNVEATLDLTRRALSLRAPGERFLLVTVSSLAAFYPMPVKATYAASKRFLLDFYRALREELRAAGVSVTVLCPAGLATTPGAIRGIEVQGIFGRVTTVETGTVAAETFDAALRAQFLVIPGRINQVLQRLSALVAPSMLARIVAWRWRANRRSAGAT